MLVRKQEQELVLWTLHNVKGVSSRLLVTVKKKNLNLRPNVPFLFRHCLHSTQPP